MNMTKEATLCTEMNILVKVREEVHYKCMLLIKLVAIGCEDSILCIMRVVVLQEDVPVKMQYREMLHTH